MRKLIFVALAFVAGSVSAHAQVDPESPSTARLKPLYGNYELVKDEVGYCQDHVVFRPIYDEPSFAGHAFPHIGLGWQDVDTNNEKAMARTRSYYDGDLLINEFEQTGYAARKQTVKLTLDFENKTVRQDNQHVTGSGSKFGNVCLYRWVSETEN